MQATDQPYKIYVHTFPNGKKYIGVSKDPVKRWWRGKGYSHNPYMTRAVMKYGWDNIEHEIVHETFNKSEAEQKEIELISKFKSNEANKGYNLEGGGNLGKEISEETRRKLSLSVKERMQDPKERMRISEKLKGRKIPRHIVEKAAKSRTGKPLSEEHKEKLRGRTMTVEAKRKISRAKMGHIVSDETKKKISDTRIKHKVCMRNPIDETVVNYESIREAARTTNISASNICQCLKGMRKTAGGYIWDYQV